jgi:hypothetical protein
MTSWSALAHILRNWLKGMPPNVSTKHLEFEAHCIQGVLHSMLSSPLRTVKTCKCEEHLIPAAMIWNPTLDSLSPPF